MGIIKTSLEVGKTIRNVGRFREIVTVFAKNGFNGFLQGPISSIVPNFVLPKPVLDEVKQGEKDNLNFPEKIAKRLRISFEELGPVFIKFGQLLSTREDMLPESFIFEMKKLRDNALTVPYDQIKASIENSLECKVEEVFSEINPVAIGNASIGIVHKATLITGEDVVLKVRRPNIVNVVHNDLDILFFLVTQLERVVAELRFLGLSRIVRDFSISLQNELNLNYEALNCEKFKLIIKNHDEDNIFHLPKMYLDYCKEDLIVMERIQGIPFSNSEAISSKLEFLHSKFEHAVAILLKNFLQDGYFHADLHGGNFFLKENGQIALIDFGLMGSLSKKSRISFTAIVYSLMSYNYENLIYEFLDVAEYDTIPDVEALISDVRSGLSPYVGLSVSQINFSEVLQVITSTLNKHRLYLPSEWFIIFRALMTLDGVGKDIKYDLDLFAVIEKDIKNIIKESMSKEDLIEEAIWAGRDIFTSLRVFPRHLKWFLKEISKKDYAITIEHANIKESAFLISNSIIFLAFVLFSALFFVSGVFLLEGSNVKSWVDIPSLVWLFWIFSSLFFIKGVSYINKKKRS